MHQKAAKHFKYPLILTKGYDSCKETMNIEYEATFVNTDKDYIRTRLRASGALLIKPEFMQKRIVFSLPPGQEIPGGWLRLRDEGEKITLSLKIIDGNTIHNQKEINLEVNSFYLSEHFLISIGCKKRAYQENRRELWQLNNVEISIDEWPFLEPFVEIEGFNEKSVKSVSKILGFNYDDAFFGSVDKLYARKYKISENIINNHIGELTFNMSNPFL